MPEPQANGRSTRHAGQFQPDAADQHHRAAPAEPEVIKKGKVEKEDEKEEKKK